jgi:predicted dinucleotide-binding enzyme
VAASVQAAVPRSHVAAALHHVPARELGDLAHPVESDVLVCSDHPSATATTSDIVAKIPGLRPLDAGELSNAAPIEAFAAVLLQLNVRYKTRAAVRFTGIEL